MVQKTLDFIRFALSAKYTPGGVTPDETITVIATSEIYDLALQRQGGNLSKFRFTITEKTDTTKQLRIGLEDVASSSVVDGKTQYVLNIRKSDAGNLMVGLANDDDGTDNDANIIANNLDALDLSTFSVDSSANLVIGTGEYAELLGQFASKTTTLTVTAGEDIDASSLPLGVSIYGGSYYKYSKFEKTVASVADNGSGKAEFTSAGHGLADGTSVALSGFSESTYNVVGVVANATTDTFYIETITYVATDTGIASGFSDLQGVIQDGQNVASGETFTLTNINGSSTGYTGLTEGLAYVESGGAVTQTPTTTTEILGRTRGATIVDHSVVIESAGNFSAADFIVQDPTDSTKGMDVDVSAKTTGTTSTLKFSGGDQVVTFPTGDFTIPRASDVLSPISDGDYLCGFVASGQEMGRVDSPATFAEATSGQPFGRISPNREKATFSQIGSGVGMTGNNFAFRKVGSPTDNLVVEVQGDDGTGKPDGTPFDSNATFSISGAALTTSFVDALRAYLASITTTKGTQYHIVCDRDGAYSDINYFEIAYVSSVDSFFNLSKYTTSWAAETNRKAYISAADGFFRSVISETDATQFETTDWIGMIIGATTLGAPVKLALPGAKAETTGLSSVEEKYFISNTPGGISTSAGTDREPVGILREGGLFEIFKEERSAFTTSLLVAASNVAASTQSISIPHGLRRKPRLLMVGVVYNDRNAATVTGATIPMIDWGQISAAGSFGAVKSNNVTEVSVTAAAASILVAKTVNAGNSQLSYFENLTADEENINYQIRKTLAGTGYTSISGKVFIYAI